tara:strand:+ start:681 stop:992 length:312 start_codon:yes stop_codon:yes gene_type:complete
MAKDDEDDGCEHGVCAVHDKGRQRILIGKQDDGAQKDQIDTQRVAERMLPLPMIPDIGHVTFPLKVQILFLGYNFIVAPNSPSAFWGRTAFVKHWTSNESNYW